VSAITLGEGYGYGSGCGYGYGRGRLAGDGCGDGDGYTYGYGVGDGYDDLSGTTMKTTTMGWSVGWGGGERDHVG